MRTARRGRTGFTLVELMVSIAIFIMLGSLLVALLRSGVDLWERGESRRDSYERAAILFDSLRGDLSCATIHREPEPAGFHPNFSCLPDRRGRPLLFFTRLGITPPQATLPLPKSVKDPAMTFFEAPDTMSRHEVVYCLDPVPGGARLYRGQFAFNDDYGLRMPLEAFEQATWVEQNTSLLGDGVLYLGFRFWSQYTQAWNPQQGERGPETRWDSTRFRDREFPLRRRNLTTNDVLDDVLPRRVEITVTLEKPSPPGYAASTLRTAMDKDAKTITATLVPSFPEGPGWVKIDDEWMTYEKKTSGSLIGVRRGQRGTAAAAHAEGAVLRYGETHTAYVAIPAYKDDPNQ